MSEINDKLDEISYSNVFFEKGDDNSAEGTYIFSTNSNYHILYAEKGKIRSDIVVNDEREVLWYALNILSTNGSLSMSENMGLMISILGIILPLAVLIDLLLDKNRKLNPKDKKTDWFYQNEEFDITRERVETG